MPESTIYPVTDYEFGYCNQIYIWDVGHILHLRKLSINAAVEKQCLGDPHQFHANADLSYYFEFDGLVFIFMQIRVRLFLLTRIRIQGLIKVV